MKPSARAQALGAPVEVPIGSMQPGEMVARAVARQTDLRAAPVEEMLARLPDTLDELRDPDSAVIEQQLDYAANDTRSVRPEFLVVEGSCTHLGCAPLEDFDGLTENWGGGFFCPCHGSKFDLSLPRL